MRKIILVILLLVTAFEAYSQNLSCEDFRTGVFQFEGNSGEYYTIVRTDSIQSEKGTRAVEHSKMKITWISNCKYFLSDRTVCKRGQEPENDNSNIKLENEIYKVESPNKFYVKTFVEGYPDTVKTLFYKLDTSKYYDDIFSLSSCQEYKNAKTYGESLLNEIYYKNYYQNSQNPTKYLLSFETSYETEEKQKVAILDQHVITINENEKIMTSDCSFNGTNSNDLLVIYKSDASEKPRIIKAFRFNVSNMKIEEVDKSEVECTITIKTRIGG